MKYELLTDEEPYIINSNNIQLQSIVTNKEQFNDLAVTS